MIAWMIDGIRVDVELAVALEVGAAALERAEDDHGVCAAVSFNRDLWRVIGDLASSSPIAEDRSALTTQARNVVDGSPDFIAINRCFASILAARAATQGTMRMMLGAWRDVRRADRDADFGSWLVRRLGGLAAPKLRSAA